MKKKIMSLAIAAIAALGFMASAQTQDNKMYSPRTFTDYAFEGVLLDIPQQQRIDSLHSALRTPATKKVHAISMNPDSLKAMPERHTGKKPMKLNGKAMGVMPGVEYVAKVKEILTPDQFDLFMSNIQAMPDNAVNNLIAAPSACPNAGKPGMHSKKGGECANAQGQQCDKKGDMKCEKKCDKPCDKKCDKPCDKKCDKPCDMKCDKKGDGQACINGADNCPKANGNTDKAHKNKKDNKDKKKDKKNKK